VAHRKRHHSPIDNCRHLTQHEVHKIHNSLTKDDPKYGSTYQRSGLSRSKLQSHQCIQSRSDRL
jgi:hypothetical protein